jgi:hypothetical protein
MPMTADTARLWEQLRTFDFDGGPAAFTFRDRLARDTGWSRRHAARVIEEYRRFLLLAAAAGHPVTPSEDVDEAWHLHLTYTRSYWDDLCGRVLPAPLHHGPTRGGAREAAKFDDWYARTLASYERLLDGAPPADIWPPPEVRFAPGRRFERVDRAHAWVVRKPACWPPRRRAAAAAVVLAATVTSACASLDMYVPLAVAILLGTGVVGMLIFQALRGRPRDPRHHDGGTTSTGCGSGGGDSGGGDSGGGDNGGGDGGGGDGGGGCGGGCGGGD